MPSRLLSAHQLGDRRAGIEELDGAAGKISAAPSRVLQCLAADSASLQSMVHAAFLVPLPLVRR